MAPTGSPGLNEGGTAATVPPIIKLATFLIYVTIWGVMVHKNPQTVLFSLGIIRQT